ncbi:MAG: hypothetical protein JNL58_23955 [Planctomyces sp.]|nr:hypothetical protein [Planctomyces sp.]
MQLKSFGRDVRCAVAPLYCCIRGLPLLLAKSPKTPLRVLCIMAFDTLYMYRRSKSMPRDSQQVLAAFLDFGASENALIDRKQYSRSEQDANEQVLLNSGHGFLLSDYVTQLRRIERLRPLPGGDRRRFEEIRAYREAVARLSLETIAAVVFDADDCRDSEGHPSLSGECRELEILFRIVMQCQVIDDVLDYSKDAAAGLPSFLTATTDLQQSIQYSAEAARTYGDLEGQSLFVATVVLRIVLFCVSNLAKAVLSVCQWRHRTFGAVRLRVEQKPVRP